MPRWPTLTTSWPAALVANANSTLSTLMRMAIAPSSSSVLVQPSLGGRQCECQRRFRLQQDAHGALVPEAFEVQLDSFLPDLQLACTALERVEISADVLGDL